MESKETTDWDEFFMSMVYLAAMKSKDNQTHMGAVVVGDNKEIRSIGYNGFVRDLDDNVQERQERPEKYYWMEHAERNAIYNASLMGVSLKGCTMYTNGVPCMDCGRAIIQSGIRTVIVDKNWEDDNSDVWLEHAKRTLEMFSEVGIRIQYFEGNIWKIARLRRGEHREF